MLPNLYSMYPKTKPYATPTLILASRISIAGKFNPLALLSIFYLVSRLSNIRFYAFLIAVPLTLNQRKNALIAEIVIPKKIILLVFTYMPSHLVEYSLIFTLVLISFLLRTRLLIAKDEALDA